MGGFTACFGQPAPGQPLKMYALGKVGSLTWTGVGECNVMKSMPPVRTVVPFNCVLDLSGLPAGYVGGFGASSTLATNLGKDADPTAHVPGYLSTSVVRFAYGVSRRKRRDSICLTPVLLAPKLPATGLLAQ